MSFESLFKNGAPIVGMVHLLALPETPDFGGDLAAIYTRAEQDTAALIEAGVDALIIENFGDEPYFNGEPTAAQFAVMAHATTRIRQITDMPIGINVQFNAWQAEVGIQCGRAVSADPAARGAASAYRATFRIDRRSMAAGSSPRCANPPFSPHSRPWWPRPRSPMPASPSVR